MFDDLYDGLKEEVEEGVNILLERKWTPYDILTKALVGGMTIVGADFRDGILFVPEVLLAANSMKGGMAILKPLLAETGAPRVGSMVIGTVKGDIHDIGKNLVSMMMEGAGFEVVDIGINNPVSIDTFLTTRDDGQSLTQAIAAILLGADVGKAFNMAQVAVWEDTDMTYDGRQMVVLYTADEEADATFAALITDVGAEPLRLGGNQHAYQLEAAAAIVIKFLFAGRDPKTIFNFIQPESKPVR